MLSIIKCVSIFNNTKNVIYTFLNFWIKTGDGNDKKILW